MKYQQPVGGASNDPYVTGVPGVTPGSIPPGGAIEHTQREILSVIVGQGLTPNADDLTQLKQAIQLMIDNSGVDHIVRYTTTGNIALTGLGTQANGDWPSSLTAGDLILAGNQTTASDNGWYVAAVGAWIRATFADASVEINSGSLTRVKEGVLYADTIWMLTTDGVITLGTTALAFARKDAQHQQQLQSIAASVALNQLTCTLKPGTTDFRSATPGDGAITSVTSSADISVVAPNGASLGMSSGVLGRITVLDINDGGSRKPAFIFQNGSNLLDESGVISTTAISAGATSANVAYSTSAISNAPYKNTGYIESTQATAGTWVTPPSKVQPAGGMAISSGKIGQIVHVESGAFASGINSFPQSNSIPINTYGDQYLIASITPINALSTFFVEVLLNCDQNSSTQSTMAIFKDASVYAIAATPTATFSPWNTQRALKAKVIPNSSAAMTFAVRAGVPSGTFYINSALGSAIYGGVCLSSITITEYLP